MRDDYLKMALAKIPDPNILVNVISRRVKQLRVGARPLVESLEKLSAEDTALREVMEEKITYELGVDETPAVGQTQAANVRNIRALGASPVEPKPKRAAKAAAATPAVEAAAS